MTGPTSARRPAYLRRRRRERGWLAAAFALTAALAILDLAVGPEARVSRYLFAAPLVAAIGSRPRPTALVGACATALAVALGSADPAGFGSTDHVLRCGAVLLGSLIGIWVAVSRERAALARRRYALLAETGRVAQSSLDPEVMLIEVARLVATELSDWCFAFLRDDGGRVRQVAAMHRDPARQKAAWQLLVRYPLDPARDEGPAAAIRDGRSRLYPEVDDDVLRAISADEENLRLLRELRMRSAMVVPLVAHGRPLGAIAFASAESRQVFTQADLSLAEEVTGRAAVAVENAGLYTEVRRAESGLRGSRDELQAILDGVADAITVQGPDGRLVYANQAAVEALGFGSMQELMSTPVGEIVGRFDFADEQGRTVSTDRLPGRLALSGDPSPEPMLLRFRRSGDRQEFWVRVKATPIFGDDGRPRLAINVLEDVTEVQEASEAQRFLAEASAILASSLDYETTLGNVARLAVPQVADWCAVDVVDDDGDIRQVVVAHTDPAKVDMAGELRRRYPVDRNAKTGAPNVVRTGRPELYPDVTDEMLVQGAVDEAQLEMLREIGMRSVMIVPMAARGRMLGTVTLVSAESGRRFGQSDLVLVQNLAARCALSVDNARLYGERAHIARTLQQSLLPPELPQPPGLEVAARFRAAGEGFDVGGDFYDVFDTGGSGWAAVIGDVCGKGPEAAAVTALARYTLRAAAMTQPEPSQILATLNEAMLRQSDERRFCTVLYASVTASPGGASIRFSSGGHPLPLILSAGGGVIQAGSPGTLLGIVPDPDLYDETVELRPGDTAILYTDGVTDAGAPDRLRDPLELALTLDAGPGASADALAQQLLDAALGDGTGEPRDDIAIVVIRVPSEPALATGGDARAAAGRGTW